MKEPTEDELAQLREALDVTALNDLALRACGLHLDTPAELAAMASIGLAVRLWRNTELEQVHDGSVGRVWFERLDAALDDASLERCSKPFPMPASCRALRSCDPECASATGFPTT